MEKPAAPADRRKVTNFSREQIATYSPALKKQYRDILAATGSYLTISADLGLNIGTVKSRLSRAREALAKEIAKATREQ